MGYVLLWIENLTGALLLTATLLACLGRLRWYRLSRPLSVVAFLLLLAIYAVTIAWLEHLRSKLVPIGIFYPLLASAACYLSKPEAGRVVAWRSR